MMIMRIKRNPRRVPINVRLPFGQANEIEKLRKLRNKNRTEQLEEVIEAGLKYFRV